MLKGIDVLTVRTYHHVPSSRRKGRFKREELTGARCFVISEGFRATVKNARPGPGARLWQGFAGKRLWNVRRRGYRNGIKSVDTFDVEKAKRRAYGANNGLLGMVVVEVINAADNDENNEFDYRVAEVYMNRIGCDKTKRGLPHGLMHR